MSTPDPGPAERRPPRAAWRERLRTAVVSIGRVRPGPVWWRLAAPATFVIAGALFVASANTAGGTDIRGGRITDLAGLAQAEADQLGELRDEQARVTAEIEALSEQLTGSPSGIVERVRELREPAGLAPVRGPGLTVTLSDAPDEVIESAETDINNLVVHQQDIQAAVNAMWRAGATAVTIQGQRLISTTGIKCEGNQVTLHGVPYSPPYVIVGIGDQAAISSELMTDPILSIYRDYTLIPGGSVTWAMGTLDDAVAPAYEGLLDLTWATPMSS